MYIELWPPEPHVLWACISSADPRVAAHFGTSPCPYHKVCTTLARAAAPVAFAWPQGDRAVLRSGGGTINGSVTAAQADLSSQGGAVQLKSLVGRAVTVASQGGPVSMGACYADEAAVDSGGR
jgi:hypothetical protein